MITFYFGSIPLGIDHLTGPVGDETAYQNTDAEHAVARGKPAVQQIGAERDVKTFRFFFDEGFCNVEAEHGRLMAALRSRSPAPLVVPGRSYRGTWYRVDALKDKTLATGRSGRLVRVEATITLKEVPMIGGLFSAIGLAFGGGAGFGINVRIG